MHRTLVNVRARVDGTGVTKQTYRHSHDPSTDALNVVKQDHEHKNPNGAIELESSQHQLKPPQPNNSLLCAGAHGCVRVRAMGQDQVRTTPNLGLSTGEEQKGRWMPLTRDGD
jgi:hypothetical protein